MNKACAAMCNVCSWKRQLASCQQNYSEVKEKFKFRRSRRLTVCKWAEVLAQH